MHKALFIVTSLNSGGIENYLLRFLRHYDGVIRPTVLCKSGCYGDLVDDYRMVKFIQLSDLKLGYFDISAYRALYSYIKINKFDVVCDFTGNFAALPLATAGFAGVHNRVAFYRGATNHFGSGLLKTAYNKAMNLLVRVVATNILSNSVAAFDFFFGKAWGNRNIFKVISNGIDGEKFLSIKSDLREELSIPSNAFVVGHVGRLDASKNHAAVIDVAMSLCKSHADIFFILCGRDVDACYGPMIQSEGLHGKVIPLGFRADVARVLNTLDCFYFPSITEGQPNALIEALIKGVPFVASNIDPIKEMIPPQFHSQLVAPMDTALAAQKILEIKSDVSKQKLLDLSEWATRQFDAQAQFEKFYDVLFEERIGKDDCVC